MILTMVLIHMQTVLSNQAEQEAKALVVFNCGAIITPTRGTP